jgi:hypothetical protein
MSTRRKTRRRCSEDKSRVIGGSITPNEYASGVESTIGRGPDQLLGGNRTPSAVAKGAASRRRLRSG